MYMMFFMILVLCNQIYIDLKVTFLIVWQHITDLHFGTRYSSIVYLIEIS